MPDHGRYASGRALARRADMPGRDTDSRLPQRIDLPAPRRTSDAILEAIIAARRSERDFAPGPLALAELAQLLWAAQGITHRDGLRTAPSAGATYPLGVYAVVGGVEGLPAGIYRYEPDNHALIAIAAGDRRHALAEAALAQHWIAGAAAILAVAAIFERTTNKYGRRGERYMHMEAGHAGQNVCLQAVALGLGTTVVGAFDDAAVAAIVDPAVPMTPFCLLPIGRIDSSRDAASPRFRHK
jgi:SagB-type dehydrogenase family enzyme